MKKIIKLILSIVICQLAGVIGAVFTTPQIKTWYVALNKPSFNPPGWIFSPVWTILFLLMGISLYLVWSKNWAVKDSGSFEKMNLVSKKLWTGSWKEENIVAIFALQLILNILWSVIFFGLEYPGLAFFELLMLWFAILYTIVNFYRASKLSAYLLVPYILWVSFAGVLNFMIWMLN